jgi:hypothetical protein
MTASQTYFRLPSYQDSTSYPPRFTTQSENCAFDGSSDPCNLPEYNITYPTPYHYYSYYPYYHPLPPYYQYYIPAYYPYFNDQHPSFYHKNINSSILGSPCPLGTSPASVKRKRKRITTASNESLSPNNEPVITTPKKRASPKFNYIQFIISAFLYTILKCQVSVQSNKIMCQVYANRKEELIQAGVFEYSHFIKYIKKYIRNLIATGNKSKYIDINNNPVTTKRQLDKIITVQFTDSINLRVRKSVIKDLLELFLQSECYTDKIDASSMSAINKNFLNTNKEELRKKVLAPLSYSPKFVNEKEQFM